MVPGEGIVQAIAVVTGRQFGNVKTAFDATLVSTALLLSLLFFHRLQGLGIGTIFPHWRWAGSWTSITGGCR